MNIKDLIAEVREHHRRATPGPWLHYKRDHPSPAWAVTDVEDEEEQRITAEGEPNDIALIAHYRTAAPFLADEVERLSAVNEELRLTLLAEQGKPEGAVSDRWRVSYNRHGFEWWRGEDDELPEVECHLSGGEWRWTKPGFESNPYPTARACMLAADAA
jgi:hypothetical protein